MCLGYFTGFVFGFLRGVVRFVFVGLFEGC